MLKEIAVERKARALENDAELALICAGANGPYAISATERTRVG